MRIALTGVTGFVGRTVLKELIARGLSPRVLVRKPEEGRLPAGLDIVRGDLSDDQALAALVREADAVIHIAGAIAALSREAYFRTNAEGTGHISRAARQAGVWRFVYVSTLSARRPELSAYGASKAAGETALSAEQGGMETIIIRPPAVYGPGDRAALPLFKALTASPALIPGRADSRFSLIYAEDLARILAEATLSHAKGCLEVSDGASEGYSWTDLAKLASTVLGRAIKPVFLPYGLTMGAAAITESMARLMGRASMVRRDKICELYQKDWVAKPPGWPLKNPTGFAQGFAQTINWYQTAGWLRPPRRPMLTS